MATLRNEVADKKDRVLLVKKKQCRNIHAVACSSENTPRKKQAWWRIKKASNSKGGIKKQEKKKRRAKEKLGSDLSSTLSFANRILILLIKNHSVEPYFWASVNSFLVQLASFFFSLFCFHSYASGTTLLSLTPLPFSSLLLFLTSALSASLPCLAVPTVGVFFFLVVDVVVVILAHRATMLCRCQSGSMVVVCVCVSMYVYACVDVSVE